MKAAVIEEIGKMSVQEIPEPHPEQGTMKIQVEACAICGSDIRIFTRGDSRAKFPCIPGHEIAGTVVEIGMGVTGFRVGDRVTVAPGISCGKCRYCEKGWGNICLDPQIAVGYASPGGFAEFMCPPRHVMENGFVNRIPGNLSFDEATLAELLACCINGQELARVTPEDTVLVIGAGPVGCMHLALARARGARKVFVLQRSEARIELAKRFAPDLVLSYFDRSWLDRLREETNGVGADVVIVAVSSREAAETALRAVSPRGRILLFAGFREGEKMLPIDGNLIHYSEVSVLGASSSLGRQNREALEIISSGKINAKDFITHTLPLEEIRQGFKIVEEKQGLKVVIKPHEK